MPFSQGQPRFAHSASKTAPLAGQTFPWLTRRPNPG